MNAAHRRIASASEAPYVAPGSGQIDFVRIDAYALARLGDVLEAFLPDGAETEDARWIGSHPKRPLRVSVSLLSGAWEEIDSGKTGRDLVSLIAHLFGLPQGEAARRLARWLGVERRHA